MEDRLERTAMIRDLGNTFQKSMRDDFVESVVKGTGFIELSLFCDCCNQIKTQEHLPFNLTRAIQAIYYRLRPIIRQENSAFCPKCNNIGVVSNYLFDPYLTWVEPCTCHVGERFDWMNHDRDRPFIQHLLSRGIKFKAGGVRAQTHRAPEREPYADF